jgi:uncharacterized 2Fe-2S/4Fe-4S cluster protein (DUF4445 family)
MSTDVAPVSTVSISYGMYNEKKSRADAIRGLQGTKYSLADIPNDSVKAALVGILSGETCWIAAWQGNDYNGGNVVLHKTGAIGVTDDADQQLSYAVEWISS